MSNTYAEYLENEQKKIVPDAAAPAVQGATPNVVAPTVDASSGYGQFLQTLANNKKIENTPTNAKTYADYLTYTGLDPVGDYQAKVRQANLEYAKAMSTYGQNAEKLAKSGLTGSGYGDYLQGLAYTGKQNAVSGAQKDAKATLEKGFSSYADYIEGLKDTNEKTAMTGILDKLLEGDAAKEYARSLGVTEDRLEYVLSQTSASVSAAKTKKLAEATSAITELVSGGQTMDAAIASLEGMYDKDTLDKVKENLQNASNAQISASINSATGVANYNETLQQQQASGAITPEQYNAQVVAGQNKNYEFVQKFVDSNDASGLAAYAEANGLDISGGTTEEVDTVVDHMVANGYLTKEQQQKYYADSWANTIADTDYNGKQAVDTVDKIFNLFKSGKVSYEQYKDLLVTIGKRAGDVYGSVEVDRKSYNNGTNVTINYKQREFGNEAIQINFSCLHAVEGVGFVAGKTIALKGGNGYRDQTLIIGTINGRVAYMKGGKYYQAKSGTPEYTNTKQNAAFIAYMMVP